MVQGYLKVNKRFLRSIAVAFDECYLSACLAVPQLIWIGLNTVMVCVAALLVAYIAVSHHLTLSRIFSLKLCMSDVMIF